MKLNPPASSSDLDVARGIARRLHHRARGTEAEPDPTPGPAASMEPPPVARRPERRAPERPPSPPDPVEPAPERELTDPELELEAPDVEPELPELAAPEFEPEPPEQAAQDLEPEPPELAAPEFEPEPPEQAAQDLEPEPPELAAPELEPEPPELETPEPEAPPPPPEPLFEPDLPGLSDEPSLPEGEPAPGVAFGADTGEFQPGEPGEPDLTEDMLEQLPPGGYGPATGSFEAGSNEEPDIGGDAAPDEDDALAGLAAPPPASDLEGLDPPESGVSPEDLLSEEPAPPQPPDWSDPAALEAEMVGGEEEPQPEAEAPVEPPSPWDEVADSCLALAPANGAMLVDPAGQVLTARGDWPEPGPEAIAGRLVSMMEKKLRAAPTRSVSAPLAGQHLTAWRVPAADGYLTVVFMADAPLKADVRPAIDTAVQAAQS